MEDTPTHRCTLCGKEATYMCSGCNTNTKYCCQDCQVQDWARHQAECTDSRRTSLESFRITQRRTMGRTNSAQLLNAVETESNHPLSEEEQADELRFYVQQIYLIVKPVIACILLSIFWVKVANSGKSDYKPMGSAAQVYSDSSSDSAGTRFLGSLQNALIIIGQIIIMTIIIACLFKHGKIKILIGFFGFVVAVLLGFMGYLLEMNLLSVFGIPVDYITLAFGLWNFTIVGLIMIFWGKGPILAQQVYLTIMSSLMAFSLTGLAEWTTWILLALLAVWDLIAVLCPFGPLKILIESSKNQSQEVPALLYSVNAVWLMAFDATQLSQSSVNLHANQQASENGRVRNYLRDSTALELDDVTPNGTPRRSRLEEEEEERSGLKLGLGDFVFYSVLIARAALFDWVTTIACTVAVMMGLNATIFLLAIKGKALPALPISIFFGILFYFIGSIMLTPCLETLSLGGVHV